MDVVGTEYYRTIIRIPSLVCYWRLNDSSLFSTATDYAGRYNLNGTYNGSPLSKNSLIFPSFGETFSNAPLSRLFGSTKQNVEVPDASPIRLVSDMTIEMWMISSNTKPTASLFNKMNSISSPNKASPYNLDIISGSISLSLGNGITQTTVSYPTVINPGYVNHVAVTCYKQQTMKIILNGIKVAEKSLSGQAIADSGMPLIIGALPNNTERFSGLLSEIALYNTALSANTIKEHYNIGKRILFRRPYYNTFDKPSYYSFS